MLIDCPSMARYRDTCEIGSFVSMYRMSQPQISSVRLYAMYLSDACVDNLKEKILALYHMKLGWHKLMKIDM